MRRELLLQMGAMDTLMSQNYLTATISASTNSNSAANVTHRRQSRTRDRRSQALRCKRAQAQQTVAGRSDGYGTFQEGSVTTKRDPFLTQAAFPFAPFSTCGESSCCKWELWTRSCISVYICVYVYVSVWVSVCICVCVCVCA